MKSIFQSTQFKLLAFIVVLLLVSIACIPGGGNENTPANPQPPANNQVDPQPVVEDPVVEPVEEENTQNEEPVEEPETEPETEPEPVSIPDEPLNTTRLLPALKDIMLIPDDLKVEYTMQNDREVGNDRMINQINWGDGREYVARTGRINGWNTYMERTNNEFAPFSYRTRVEVFETVEGAQLAFSDDWNFIFNDTNLEITEFLDLACAFGNECVLAFFEENIPGTTDFNSSYHLVFRYRNTIVYVFAKGLEGTTTEETVFEVADLMISRLDMFQ
jgi:hypothetical protein